MQPAVIPQSMIAERHRLGLDKKDEMWDGVLHMNEPGSFEHQRTELRLAALLLPLADRLGLTVLVEAGVFDPARADYSNYRTPDIVVVHPDAASERGVEGRAELVAEIRSPDDESFQKIRYYGRMGVRELLIIDRDTKDVRQWLNDGAGNLVEEPGPADGWRPLASLPVALRGGDGVLDVRVDDEERRV
jgi:Uma2 family endonuclease